VPNAQQERTLRPQVRLPLALVKHAQADTGVLQVKPNALFVNLAQRGHITRWNVLLLQPESARAVLPEHTPLAPTRARVLIVAMGLTHLKDLPAAKLVRHVILGIILQRHVLIALIPNAGNVMLVTMQVVRMKRVALSVPRGLTGAKMEPPHVKRAQCVNQDTTCRVIVLQ